MDLHAIDANRRGADDYLFGRGQAWFALVMTIGLMVMIFSFRTSVDAWIHHGMVPSAGLVHSPRMHRFKD